MSRRAYSVAVVSNVVTLYLQFHSISRVHTLTGVARNTIREMINGKYSERPRVQHLHAAREEETEPGELHFRTVRRYLCSCGMYTTLKPCCACVAEAYREVNGIPQVSIAEDFAQVQTAVCDPACQEPELMVQAFLAGGRC